MSLRLAPLLAVAGCWLAAPLVAKGEARAGGGPAAARAVAVAAGDRHSLALMEDGTLLAWGANQHGQLGAPGEARSSRPQPVPGLPELIRVACGSGHALAIDRDGSPWSWGWNVEGQLGRGTTSRAEAPGRIAGLAGARALAAGRVHSLAVTDSGEVWAWGSGEHGQLGNASLKRVPSPVRLPALRGARALEAGGLFSLALDGEGRVRVWGSNWFGQLADGRHDFRARSAVPRVVAGLDGVRALAAGGVHVLALDAEGAARGWGGNFKGQLGDGTKETRTAPARVSAGRRLMAVSAGERFSMALAEDGTVLAWGDDKYGQLGAGTAGKGTPTPSAVSGLPRIQAIAAGGFHALALDAEGGVWAWGRNADGQLGDGTEEDSARPLRVLPPE